MSHTHISQEDWPCIARMLRAGHSIVSIAETIGKDQSALGRHIATHGGRHRYSVAEVRRYKRMTRIRAMESVRRISGSLLQRIVSLLKAHRSPEQIAGILKAQKARVPVGTNTIYRYIKTRAPHLKQYLRRSQKRRRKYGSVTTPLSLQKNKPRIDERPPIVERRSRIGDFEGDTMMGRDKRVRIVTYVDRKSGYLVAFLLPLMRAELLTDLTAKTFRTIPRRKRKTVTFDNGTEFSDWKRLGKKLGFRVYFAYPYHAWERGTNENTNGLLREYFPKKYDFNLITENELADVVLEINNRERKRLGFLSPRRVFWKR